MRNANSITSVEGHSKTFVKDYTLEASSLLPCNNDLEEVTNQRQELFMSTEEYKKAKEKVMTALKRIKIAIDAAQEYIYRVKVNDQALLPDNKLVGELEYIIFGLECECFSAGYKAGVADLMTVMAFNDLGLTKAEYIKLGGNK